MAGRAKDIISQYDRLWNNSVNFMSLCQGTADYVYPLENQILSKDTNVSTPKTIDLVDTTAIFASMDMVSGLSSLLFPPGQQNFLIQASDRELREIDEVQYYTSVFSEILQDRLFESNFQLQFDEALASWVNFGEGNLKCDDDGQGGLEFKDYPAGGFVYAENSKGRADTFMEKFDWTARQCVQEWGIENVGKTIREAYEEEKTREDKFWLVHLIGPRKVDNPRRIGGATLSVDKAFEDVYVAVTDQLIIYEGGYDEFPHSIARYRKSSREHRGRGVGTQVLPKARGLNAMVRDMIECGNRHNRPPLEVVTANLGGEVCLDPGALNHVSEKQSINAIASALGNYPITQDIIESEREDLRKAFMVDVLNQLINLTGDRRTTLEISERLNEGLRRLSQPIARLTTEMLTPQITRAAMILIRNDESLRPPPVLQGRGFGVKYISPMMLALQRYQASAFVQWAQLVGEMEAVFPGVRDNVNEDKAIRDIGDAFGIKAEHKRPMAEVQQRREQRAREIEQQKAAEMAAMAAQGYKDTTKAPEDGSLAGALSG